jgi:hypothetical protein
MTKRRVKRHPVTQPADKPYRFIPLTQGKNAIVDAEDFEWLSKNDSHRTHIGTFDSAEQAARAYDRFAKILHGEFAHLNYPMASNVSTSLPQVKQ